MSPVKAARDGTRTTRQSMTRASTQARPVFADKDEVGHTSSSDRRARRRSSSPISSLSPSPQKPTGGLPAPQATAKMPTSTAAPTATRASRDKGKGKAVEPPAGQVEAGRPGKRVLPARIRRAAGGGQEGFRDLENTIVDWLDRYGMSPVNSHQDGL